MIHLHHLGMVRSLFHVQRAVVVCALALAALQACDAAGERPPPGLPCTTPDTPPGFDQNPSYAADRMLCVQLQMDAAAFESLRVENRFGVSNEVVIDELLARMTDGCVEPHPSRYTWHQADVRIDGAALQRVGIRKKGFLGSVIGQGLFKPSLKLKTDRVVAKQLFGETERVTLNNNNQDATRMQTCLAYQLFAAADYPAPRCNLANVMLNGVSLGAYTHVEPIKKPALKRMFGDASGSLYEGALADFTPGHIAGFPDQKLGRWEAKTGATDPTGAPLKKLTDALQVPDSELLAALAPVLNLDRFIRFWALEILINHGDGYAANRNNFFVYFDPADQGRATFMPWGADNVFNGERKVDRGALATFTFAELPRRLSRIPAVATQLVAELRRLLNEVWDAEAILAQVDTFEAQVETAQVDDGYRAGVTTLRGWISGRRAEMEAALKAGLPGGAAAGALCTEFPGGGIADGQAGLTIFTALVFGW